MAEAGGAAVSDHAHAHERSRSMRGIGAAAHASTWSDRLVSGR